MYTVDYDSYLTKRSAARKPSPIRALQPLLSIPGMISLGGGMPNESLFPFESMTLKLKGGATIEIKDADMKYDMPSYRLAGVPCGCCFMLFSMLWPRLL